MQRTHRIGRVIEACVRIRFHCVPRPQRQTALERRPIAEQSDMQFATRIGDLGEPTVIRKIMLAVQMCVRSAQPRFSRPLKNGLMVRHRDVPSENPA